MSIISSSPADRLGGGWLARHRWKTALAVAVVEGAVAAVHGTSRFVVLGLAVLALFVYFRWGRAAESGLAGQLAWIGATSQVLVILLVVVAFFVGLLVFVGVAALAVIALALLFLERGESR